MILKKAWVPANEHPTRKSWGISGSSAEGHGLARHLMLRPTPCGQSGEGRIGMRTLLVIALAAAGLSAAALAQRVISKKKS